MRYVDKSDLMTNTYSLSRQTNKLFSYLLDLTILNSFIMHASFCSKLSHQQFRLKLVRGLIKEAGRLHQPKTTRQERQAPFTRQLKKPDVRHDKHCLCNVREFGAMCIPLKTKK